MTKKSLVSFSLALFFVLLIDQAIKWWFVQNNFEYQGNIISLVLAYNQGVAFSLFDFLKEWLKYLQILLLIGIFAYLLKHIVIFHAHSLPPNSNLNAAAPSSPASTRTVVS